ncbi:TRAP transporter fused permease subunit [Marinobacter nanhaiticus D15-8W]|uniref:TRAP transporter permease DctM/Q n=1 Tax=Marinobacter nanhaiticus D15-8W TaxID=626887 RepID=N6WTI1_9GAMM|nr:TRAP transporter permease [Marinobacter nanhaiticus]ENO14806.1 TRAP transporter permease DctM/Q [Marinobacter nanhaiticus D15-8W]BES69505.1 TRAP transporter fused permease subunit [Marinobacter nanhaiticus D15-8W]
MTSENHKHDQAPTVTEDEDHILAHDVDEEPVESNRRLFTGWVLQAVTAMAIAYSAFHLYTLNIAPLETWSFRIVHVCGALILGFTLYAGARFVSETEGAARNRWTTWLSVVALLPALYALYQTFNIHQMINAGTMRIPPEIETWHFGWPLLAATGLGIVVSWFHVRGRAVFSLPDVVLSICAVASAVYFLEVYNTSMRMSTGTSFAPIGISFAAIAGTALIMEMTRRVAGMALVVIALVFLAYVFAGPYLPGFLGYPGLSVQRFFSQVYTDAGVLGPTTAVSSTYIILFIIFAAFLQASKVGDYFVNFAFAAAGRSRGGPAKVAIFASGLMGMINGTSAGNVVSTGSLTIPLMKKVGYKKQTAGAVEAAASTGGQIMPPIMGAGAFIMAEITGIPYTEIAIAAIIPAILYFASVYFMVDFEAARLGMRGMRQDELPRLGRLIKQVYLFIPIIILIYALFMGYSVIRAGTLATVSAAVVSWISPNKMGIRAILRALDLAGIMSIQIIVVCACAGVIVGVISLTGVGARFSSLLLGVAEANQLLALVFAMFISILLGMGMPTTAAYAVAASVVAPGLVEMGIEPLTAHFFVFYFAVVSAITPPVALASYAAAGISGANAMETSVASFRIGLAAFVVPFMFFYNSALLMDASVWQIARALITATFGVYLLSGGVIGWIFRSTAPWFTRIILIAAALLMIEGGLYTDLAGIAVAVVVYLMQKQRGPSHGEPVRAS